MPRDEGAKVVSLFRQIENSNRDKINSPVLFFFFFIQVYIFLLPFPFRFPIPSSYDIKLPFHFLFMQPSSPVKIVVITNFKSYPHANHIPNTRINIRLSTQNLARFVIWDVKTLIIFKLYITVISLLQTFKMQSV